ERRHHHHELPAIATREVRAQLAVLVRILDVPPQIAVLNAAQVVQRRACTLREVCIENALAVPHAAVEHDLTELHEIARQDPQTAAAIGLTGAIDRPAVGSELQRLTDQTVVQGQY